MILLDLFCGAGGCAVGYHRAGFRHIIGVDIEPQPRYPFEFVRGDALEVLANFGNRFDAIHASPPCQRYSSITKLWGKGGTEVHPDLVGPVRDGLRRAGVPYVIENVPNAPLIEPLMLCGSMFGLGVRRHRLFESNVTLIAPACGCRHREQGPIVGVYGKAGGSSARDRRVAAEMGRAVMPRGKVADWQRAMGIDWMGEKGLRQAIPPAYTEWIGQQLIAHINSGGK